MLPSPLAVLPGDRARCLVMGVVNVTPDSFSDGGLYLDAAAALRHGHALIEAGADLLDVGGESTRPGAARIRLEEEVRRVVPVVSALSAAGALVSVDTTRAEVAAAAIDAGAVLVNDVSGGLADARLPGVAASAGVAYVAMHWRGHSDVMDSLVHYDDVLAEVVAALRLRLERLADAGLDPSQVILDPGLGFAKTAAHNWTLLAGLGTLVALGQPVLVGASRKRFLGSLLPGPDGTPASPPDRDDATAATSVLAAAAGAWAVRVHDVRASAVAVRVVEAVAAAGGVAGGAAS